MRPSPCACPSLWAALPCPAPPPPQAQDRLQGGGAWPPSPRACLSPPPRSCPPGTRVTCPPHTQGRETSARDPEAPRDSSASSAGMNVNLHVHALSPGHRPAANTRAPQRAGQREARGGPFHRGQLPGRAPAHTRAQACPRTAEPGSGSHPWGLGRVPGRHLGAVVLQAQSFLDKLGRRGNMGAMGQPRELRREARPGCRRPRTRGHGRHREQHLQAVAEPHDLTLPSSCTPARSSLQGAPEAGSRRSEVTGLDGMTDWVSAKGAHARPFLSTRMWPQPLPPPKAPQTNIARSAPDGTVPLTRSSGEKIRAPRVTNMPGTSLEPTRASRLQSGRLCPHGAYLGVGSQQRSGGGGWRHRLALWLDQSQLPPWGQSCLWVLVWRLQPNPAAAHLRGAREAGSPGPLPASRSPHAKALGTLPRAVRPTGRPHPGWMPSSPRAVATRKLDSQPLPSSLLGPQLRRSTHPRRTA